jgi:hypothetical protein
MDDTKKQVDSDSSDLKKRERRTSDVTEPLRKAAQRSTNVVGDFAAAVSSGFKEYSDTLDATDSRRRGLNQVMWEGAVAGYARFLRRLAESSDETLKEIRADKDEGPERSPEVQIDYERLAKLVALELAKNQKT